MAKVIEYAERRMANEVEENKAGADNDHLLRYWAAYLDGARAQKEEDERAKK